MKARISRFILVRLQRLFKSAEAALNELIVLLCRCCCVAELNARASYKSDRAQSPGAAAVQLTRRCCRS